MKRLWKGFLEKDPKIRTVRMGHDLGQPQMLTQYVTIALGNRKVFCLQKNDLISSEQWVIMKIINKGPSLLAARFRSEGKSICQEWQPEVWDYENFFERGVSQWPMEL